MNNHDHTKKHNWNHWYISIVVVLIALILFFYFFTQQFK